MTGDKTQDPRLPHSSESLREITRQKAGELADVVAAARTLRNAHAMHGLEFDAPRWALEALYEALEKLDA